MTQEEYQNDSLPISSTEVDKKPMTEQTTASPIMNILPNGSAGNGDGYGGMGALASILPIALLAPLLSGINRNGTSTGLADIQTLTDLGSVRKDIGDSKFELMKATNDQSMTFLQRAFEAEKAGMTAGFEAKLETLKAVNLLDNKIDRRTEVLERMIENLDRSLGGKLADANVANLQGTVSILKDQIAGMTASNNTNAVISALKGVTCTSLDSCGCGSIVPSSKKA